MREVPMNEVVYNEDLVKTVENKYLAVNIVAKRARQINADGLPIVPSSAANKEQKPVAIATQELIDGKLHYEQGEANVPVSTPPSIFTDPQDSDDGSDIFGEEAVHDGGQDIEEEEPEEGL
jgi:DNA-directed RNA polymerase omega subunit